MRPIRQAHTDAATYGVCATVRRSKCGTAVGLTRVTCTEANAAGAVPAALVGACGFIRLHAAHAAHAIHATPTPVTQQRKAQGCN